LLAAHPWLARADPDTAAKLAERVLYALEAQELSRQARRDLEAVQYLLTEDRV
jgi:hypothetical protein